MSEDDRAAKAARAKAMLKKRQAAKKGGAVASGIASPTSERAFSPAPTEPPPLPAATEEKVEENPRDISDVFGKDDSTQGDTSWLNGLTRAPSPPPPASAVASPPPPAASIPANGHANDAKFEELRLENEQLKSTLDQIRSESENFKLSLAELRSENSSLQSRLAELDALKSRNTSLETELSNAKKERDAVSSKVDELSSRIKELEQHAKQHEGSRTELEGELDGVREELRRTESQLSEEQAKSQELESRVEQIQIEKENSIQNERQTITLLVSEKATLTSELERLEGVEANAQNVENQLSEERDKSKQLEQQLEELKAEHRDISTKNQVLQVKEKELVEKTREQERQLQLANGSISSLRKESESHRRRVKELEEQIQSDDRADKLEASLKNTQDRADELEFQLSKLKQTHASVKSERDDFETRLKTHQTGEEEWKTKHNALEQEHGSIQAQITSLTSEKSDLVQERAALQGQVSKAEEAFTLLQSKLKQAAEELATSTRNLKAAQTEAKNATHRADEAERIQKDLQAEGTNLMRSLDEMRPKIVELTGVKLELSEKVEGLERALNARDQVIAQLESSLEEVRDEKEVTEKQWQTTLDEREKERKNEEDSSNELSTAYAKLQVELDEALASLRSLEADRAKNHQETSQRMKEMERLTAVAVSQSEELATLKDELEQRSGAQSEGEAFIERAQNEIEALRQDLASKEEEIQRLNESSSKISTGGPRSLDDEMLGSYKQQHDLELSAAQSHIRALETAMFDAEARSHSLIKQVASLEDQLAAHVRSGSRPSSRQSNDLHRAAVTSSSRLKHRTTPSVSLPYDAQLSDETRHKRKVSLGMLKARIDREAAAAAHSRPLSPVPSISSNGSGRQTSNSATASKLSLLQHQHVRPQFLDDSHVFWCGSCKGDLVVL